MTEAYDDVTTAPLLTQAEAAELQRAIEAGLLAREARVSGAGFADATDLELTLLEDQGAMSRQRFIQTWVWLGWSVDSLRRVASSPMPNFSRRVASGFPLVNYLPVALRARA